MGSVDHSGITYSILTVSDRCANGLAQDLSGGALQDLVKKRKGNVINYSVIPDDVQTIETKLRSWVGESLTHIILTTGGTGFAPRDVTPEATLKVIEKRAQGMEVAMSLASLKSTPFGMLSRAVCGISKGVLIVNLPGSQKGALECYEAIAHTLPHAVALLRDDLPRVKSTHGEDSVQETENIIVSQVSCEVVGRPRQSEWKMVEDTEAHSIINQVIRSSKNVGVETVSVKDAHSRILAEDIVSSLNIPAFDVSLKDGYAVKSENQDQIRVVANHSEPASSYLNQEHAESSARCEANLYLLKPKFRPMDKVFVKVMGFSPWPARIIRLVDNTPHEIMYHAFLYGTREIVVCKAEDIFDFRENKTRFGKGDPRNLFAEALNEMASDSSEPVSLFKTVKKELLSDIYDSDVESKPMSNENGSSILNDSKKILVNKIEANLTTPQRKPNLKREGQNLSAAKETARSNSASPHQETNSEVTSSSGRKIKRKKFLDEFLI